MLYNKTSYLTNSCFSFLNINHCFNSGIDWNHTEYGKLWTYNLNYFDFLNQENITSKEGKFLIYDYIKKANERIDGKEPYTISLRGINWIKFISKRKINEEAINRFLYNDYQRLLDNLEYHLLGNHLLENGFSLLFGSFYFRDEKLYSNAKRIIQKELKEQILEDGGHYELSPMYHQIILFRILECYNLIISNKWKDELEQLLKDTALRMLEWLQSITFDNGEIPYVNDSAFGIAPPSKELIAYAKRLGLNAHKGVLSESGYRKFEFNGFELLMDVGHISPSYQPGHSHADSLSFILHVNKTPIFIDTGVSTYENNTRRAYERSTRAHNTVTVQGKDSSDVWGAFRVGKRANVNILKDEKKIIKAIHDGYNNIGCSHERSWMIDDNDSLVIEDRIGSSTGVFNLIISPSINKILLNDKSVFIDGVILEFEGYLSSIQMEEIGVSNEFNIVENTRKILVEFYDSLNTRIRYLNKQDTL
ncbi:alginate lyase family protein [Galbibacter orientalis]|uniref:alginate lyase family protein n=1 Tax=Galbibacter orientalis TaxID=453852 RepID=UPI00145E771A|nr:alginate lyase family protein [Galbibacter orientalis]